MSIRNITHYYKAIEDVLNMDHNTLRKSVLGHYRAICEDLERIAIRVSPAGPHNIDFEWDLSKIVYLYQLEGGPYVRVAINPETNVVIVGLERFDGTKIPKVFHKLVESHKLIIPSGARF